MPRSAQYNAEQRPITPPPMIRTFLTYPPAKRIAIVEDERRLGGDVRGAGNARRDLAARAVEPFVRSLEAAADDALLHPGLAFGELAVRGEAGELRARAGAAGRAIVGLAGAQDEVACLGARRSGRPEELDMVDVRVALGI